MNRRNCVHTAVYCCTSSSRSVAGRSNRSRLKEELASELLMRFAAETDDALRPDNSRTTLRIVSNGLGKPELYIGEDKGPAISFSYTSDTIWAALCSTAAGLGIDAADGSEFDGVYPFHRVFHTDELSMALEMCHENMKDAAALLWSAKEALLKALGCGFHLLDPLEVLVCGITGLREEVECSLRLTEDAQNRFPELSGEGFPVSSTKWGKTWVSIAAISECASASGLNCSAVAKSWNACEVYKDTNLVIRPPS